MTINTVKDMFRARARRDRDVSALALVEDGECRCLPQDHAGEDAAALWQAVHALPERQRDAVLLVYAQGMKHAEAAQVLGCRESTLSWHVHEARKTLRQQLGNESNG